MVPDGLEAELATLRPELLDLSRRVHANPELAFGERRACAWTAELLTKHGFELVPRSDIWETAFVARWVGSRPGPVVAFVGEYDALPEIGHACGHNLMCSSSAGAGIAVARVLGRDFSGEVRFVGTPAEEAGNGKVKLIEGGVFDDVAAALQFHPNDRTSAAIECLALADIGVDFHGRAAHPVGAPWNGHNALDALLLFYEGVSHWRASQRPGQAVHGIITNGGASPNTIPAETSGRFFLRASADDELDEMIARFHVMAEAAASAAGCTVTYREPVGNRTRTMWNNPTLLRLCRKQLAAIGWEDGPTPTALGSTDMTNLSHVVPTIHPYIASAPRGVGLHTREFAEAAGGPSGEKALMAAARVLAGVALDVLRDERLAAAAHAELRSMRGQPATAPPALRR